MIDTAKSKASELARQYENEEVSGINIEMAKQVLKEEDQFDKKRFREKIREKHKEEKRKLKAKKKAETEEEPKEDEFGMESDDSYEPDLSWLPDPDKIYGKKEDGDEKSEHEDSMEETSDKDSIDEKIHR